MNPAVSYEPINICGVLVHASPSKLDIVKANLLAFDGVEIHELTNDGRLIITIDLPERHLMADTINQIHSVEGVLSAAMVYQHSE